MTPRCYLCNAPAPTGGWFRIPYGEAWVCRKCQPTEDAVKGSRDSTEKVRA